MALRWLLPFVIPALVLCARPYSGRIKIAPETLLQASDRGIAYAAMLDAAIDGSPAEFARFIRLMHRLDTAGRYFHGFHIYEAAEQTGDERFDAALGALNPDEVKVLASDLAEARGWLKRDKTFAVAFPRASGRLRRQGIKVDF